MPPIGRIGDGVEDGRLETAMNLEGLRRPLVSAVLVVTCMSSTLLWAGGAVLGTTTTIVDRLQRTEESIVVDTGAPREARCLPWVVLGVKAIEAPSVLAA
jgi:hypothetical protein